MAEESPQEVVINNSLPQKKVSVLIDVAHLGKVGSPEECSLADLSSLTFTPRWLGARVSDIYAKPAVESPRRGREFQVG